MSVRLAPATATPNTATSLTLDTPAQATPGASITMTGTYKGDPQSLDYNLGAGWVTASQVTFSGGVYSFTVPAGAAAGTYNAVQVRDHDAPAVMGQAGGFVVSAWTPETLSTSPGARAVFEFNANDPAIAARTSDLTVHKVVNSVDTTQSLTAEVASGGNGVVIADSSGKDGTHRVLQFQPTKISPDKYDASTNWLGAGGVGGSAGSALVGLADSSNLSNDGSFTTIIAMDIDTNASDPHGADYEAGQIWGTLSTPGPLQYIQLRLNPGSNAQGANLADSSMVGVNAKGPITNGWHVLTMIKSAGVLTYRLDGNLVANSAITSTAGFKAADFMIGGGFPPPSSASAGTENGVPPPFVGEFQAYSGVLSGTDLANAEKLAGNSIGLALNPTGLGAGPTIALSSPGTVQEASVGIGVTINETITTTGLSGNVYEEVLTAAGAVETGYQAVALASNGTATVSVHLAHSGDTIRVVDNTASPSVTTNSTAVTITDPAPKALTATLPSPLYTGIQTVTGTGGVAGLQLERITQGSYNSPGQSGWVAATVAADGSWSALLTFSKPGMLSHVYAENGGSSKVIDLVDGTPSTPPSGTPTPTLALSAPGTLQEATVGAGVIANETLTTTNLTGSVYEEVLTSTGAVETGFQAIALSPGGTTGFSVHLAHSGDVIRVVDNIASPTVTATSSAVTITDPAPAGTPLAATLPSPLYTGTQTVTGTGGVAGLQLERITQGSYNTPGQSGWVAATVATDGSWSASLTFSKPGMLAHVYAENGGSSKVIDLVDGTPSTPPSLSQAVRNVTVSQGAAASDFALPASGGSSQAILQPQTSHGGIAASVLNDLSAKSAGIVLPAHQV